MMILFLLHIVLLHLHKNNATAITVMPVAKRKKIQV
jgi:hypothetical protein